MPADFLTRQTPTPRRTRDGPASGPGKRPALVPEQPCCFANELGWIGGSRLFARRRSTPSRAAAAAAPSASSAFSALPRFRVRRQFRTPTPATTTAPRLERQQHHQQAEIGRRRRVGQAAEEQAKQGLSLPLPVRGLVVVATAVNSSPIAPTQLPYT